MTQYIETERARYWPLSAELLAQYNDGTNTDRNRYGRLEWRQNGQQHRDDDKPAQIFANGTLIWSKNGLQHRDGDKPAVIFADGRLVWYQNNQRHRTSGPAVIWANGTLEWWVRGKNITKEVRAWLLDTEWQGTPEQIAEFQLRFC
jgi:hypothetical protein